MPALTHNNHRRHGACVRASLASAALSLALVGPLAAGILSGPVINPGTGHTYYLLTQNTWSASEAEAVALGGHLVTINDSAENDWVLNTFSRLGGSARTLWIGLHDSATEGTFVWSSGQPATFRNWAAGEPSAGSADEDYVHLYELDRGASAGQWNVHTDQNTESGVPLHGVVELPLVVANVRAAQRPDATNLVDIDYFALIPAGPFQMGNALSASGDGYSCELPVHTVNVSAFYMAKHEVSKALWDEVRTWGLAHNYTDLGAGEGKAANHPVQTITWYDMVKWCNARSEKEGLTPCYTVSGAIYKTTNNDAVACNWAANGYRLPTEAEWEKAARGGVSGKRFPWGDTINHSYVNYYNYNYFYESPQNQGHHPLWSNNDDGNYPYTSPVGSFAPNGYGLYDVAGNVWEWCWDWYGAYTSETQVDPQGSVSGFYRVIRGGSWNDFAHDSRCAYRNLDWPSHAYYAGYGFRLARGQP